ncbi:MAG: amino acid ABC transporter permease [Phototrophicales bacterium]
MATIEYPQDDVILDPLEEGASRSAPKQSRILHVLFNLPWWAFFMAGVGIFVAVSIAADETYSNIFNQLKDGVRITLTVTFSSYAAALIIGAVIGIIRATKPQLRSGLRNGLLSFLHMILYNVTTVYVEVLRGLPIVTVLLIGAFIITPEIREYLEATFNTEIQLRGMSMETAIIALSLAYGAFLSEVFRAGIQSVDKGQIEAAKALGLTNWQTMRHIIMPQAFRRILPPLGNDFIAMIKDSSLVTLLGVNDVTHIAKKSSGSSFKVLETYLTVAVIYLSMTFLGSLLVRYIERWVGQDKKTR